MFDRIRRPGRSYKENSFKKIISYIIFGFICIIFVFLVPMVSQIFGESVLAYVGSEAVRSRELNFFSFDVKQEYQKQLDEAEGEEHLKIQQKIQDISLSKVIQLYLLVQGSKKDGFFISNKELQNYISSLPPFQENGQFLYSKYKLFLKRQNLRASRFEESFRKINHQKAWLDLFQKSLFKNQLEIQKDLKKQTYKINLQYVSLKIKDIKEEKLEDFLKAGDFKKVQSLLKKHQKTWKTTGEFRLFSPFDISLFQKQNVVESLIHHLPKKGLIPKPIWDLDQVYIVQILSFKKEALNENEKQVHDLLNKNFGKSHRLIEKWLEEQYKKIKVKRVSSRRF